ncbi:MAG TPA: hypothetical protein VHM28_08690 [Anaerolineales bacterium]|nr:hypothetical protein [Anaerolineales bacterium]
MRFDLRIPVYGNVILTLLIATYLFFMPAGILIHDLRDPGLSTGETPRFTFRWHQSLSKRYEVWARERVASGRATQLNTYNISGTEWPMFSAAFYLWATETLEESWKADPSLAPEAPSQYAHGAIEATAALVADPGNAAWVKNHWGPDYLHHEDLFYRMLLISGLTSYQKLSGQKTYESLLRDQVESLAKEIDESPFGLLDDYPGECYPIDILPAIAAIRRADAVLGTDHSAFAERALRAFESSRLDPATGLPTYVADSMTGQGYGSARGIGSSFMLIWAPELWPQTATEWYGRYDQYFWQEGPMLAGFREFPRAYPMPSFWLDVDAGPVIADYGTAASAFGIGSARVNGHFEQAYPLSAEALVASWPLPDDTLLAPRLLSNLSDAPYVGETALLFSFTRKPLLKSPDSADLRLPGVVYLALGFYILCGLALVWVAALRAWGWRNWDETFQGPTWQPILWITLVFTAIIAFIMSAGAVGALSLLVALIMPFRANNF